MSYNNEYIEWSEWDSEKNNCLENNNFIDFINNNSIGFQPSTPIESKSINSWIRMLSLIGKAILTSFPVSSSYTSIGPSSNIDDIVTFIQDEFSTKISNEINKIKPNAWEERKFRIMDDEVSMDATTYNPVTDINVPVNIQKSFTDKDTYSTSDTINSYSFATSIKVNSSDSSANWFIYAVCANPSITIKDIETILDTTSKNAIVFYKIDTDPASEPAYFININCNKLKTSSLAFYNSNLYIDTITNNDDKSERSILTAYAIDNYYLKRADASNTYLTKINASNTYATKNELNNANKRIDALDTGTFDVDLTTSGLAKIKANVSIGTPITLTKDTDFSQYLDYTNYKTVIFTLYMDDNENYFISTDIKLNVGDTADVYGDNDQNYTWLTGIGVIKLGPNLNGNNYLCYISYSQGYTSPLVITPIQKLA